jgi:hypothetical protein
MASLPGSRPSAHPLRTRRGGTAAIRCAARQAFPLILCLMTLPGVARSQAQPHFTVHHRIVFVTGSAQDREQLSAISPANAIVAEPFEIAREDLNDDGTKETIIMSTTSCGSGGCATLVLEDRGGTATPILDMLIHSPLAVTNEKVGSYRALAMVDDYGAILIDERPGPTLGKQIAYPMNPPAAAPTAAASAPPVVEGQPPSHFTVHHLIQFETGTDRDREELSAIPMARVIFVVTKSFEIAREDLNDDGTKEIIIRSRSGCTSSGCQTWVLENQRGRAVFILGGLGYYMLPRLAVTNEKVGSYRALAPLDDHGEIVMDEKPGPRFGKQIVYAPAVPRARAAYSAPPKILIREACLGDPNCTEVPAFFAIVTDFRLNLVRDTRVITATVRLGNKQDRTMLMGYVMGSGMVVDERGNRYSVLGPRDVRVIGEYSMPAMRLDGAEQMGPRFSLDPGGLRDVRFEFALQPGNQDFGTRYTIDLTMREIEAVTFNEWQLGKEFHLHFSGFTDSGITPSAPSTSTPAEAKLAGAYMSKGGPSMLERLTFTSDSSVKIEDGIATRMGTYVIQGRKVTVTWGPGDSWVFTIDGKGCLVGDVVSMEATLCRQ